MTQRKLIFVFACALAAAVPAAVRTTAAHAASTVAQTSATDGLRVATQAMNAAGDLANYLGSIERAGGRPDFSQPKTADLFRRVFDVGALESLPAVRGDDLLWLLDWAQAANTINKAIMFVGIAPPVNPVRDAEAIGRNLVAFEDQQAIIENFLLRITAREAEAAVMFMDGLPPAQRTTIRIEGFRKMRALHAEMLVSFLCVAEKMKPANARLVSAAMRDTGKDWTTAIPRDDRPGVLAMLDQVRTSTTDEPTRTNLSAFRDLLATAN